MRDAMRVLGTTVLGLVLTLTVTGCDELLPSEADARFSEGLAEAPMDLSGTWLLNEEESDRPGPVREGPRHGGTEFTPHAPPTPPADGGGLPGAERLTVEQDEGEVTFTNGSGRSLTVVTDGSWRNVGGEHGTLRIRAAWTSEALIVEREGQRGLLTRTYELGDDGDRLLVSSRIENGPKGGPAEFTLVFDRADAG